MFNTWSHTCGIHDNIHGIYMINTWSVHDMYWSCIDHVHTMYSLEHNASNMILHVQYMNSRYPYMSCMDSCINSVKIMYKTCLIMSGTWPIHDSIHDNFFGFIHDNLHDLYMPYMTSCMYTWSIHVIHDVMYTYMIYTCYTCPYMRGTLLRLAISGWPRWL